MKTKSSTYNFLRNELKENIRQHNLHYGNSSWKVCKQWHAFQLNRANSYNIKMVVMNAKAFSRLFDGVYLPQFLRENAPSLLFSNQAISFAIMLGSRRVFYQRRTFSLRYNMCLSDGITYLFLIFFPLLQKLSTLKERWRHPTLGLRTQEQWKLDLIYKL